MKHINKLSIALMAGCAFAVASCCEEFVRESSQANNKTVYAQKSMYQNMCENENLKDFAAIIDKANYTKTLDAPQCYTLWAPIDGTYDASAILAMDSAQIVDKFINMHLAQFSYPVSGTVDRSVITLNNKHHTFTNTTFDNLKIVDSNIPSANGLIHTINGISEYFPNVYEFLDEIDDCDSLANYIHSYDILYVDRHKSIEGPMVNGQQTYLDTVWARRNTVIGQIMRADIEDEDSTYTVLFPTNDAWTKAVDKISPLYKYISPVKYMDLTKSTVAAASLAASTAAADKPVEIDAALYRDSLPRYQIVRNLAFSNGYTQNNPLLTMQAAANDTLRSGSGTRLTNVRELLTHCGDLHKMSNGYVRKLDSISFHPWQTYERNISVAKPLRTLGLKSTATYTQNTFGKDSLIEKYSDMFSEVPKFIQNWIFPQESKHFTYFSTDSINLYNVSSVPEFDFALNNVLSTKYHIYVVLVPSQLREPERPISEGSTEVKNLYLRFDMSYTDENGAQQYKRINVPGAKKVADDIVVINDGKFHVVELEFTFPICYYGLDAFPTLCMSNLKKFGSTANRRKWEQELRVAGVFCVPEGSYNYIHNLNY